MKDNFTDTLLSQHQIFGAICRYGEFISVCGFLEKQALKVFYRKMAAWMSELMVVEISNVMKLGRYERKHSFICRYEGLWEIPAAGSQNVVKPSTGASCNHVLRPLGWECATYERVFYSRWIFLFFLNFFFVVLPHQFSTFSSIWLQPWNATKWCNFIKHDIRLKSSPTYCQ